VCIILSCMLYIEHACNRDLAIYWSCKIESFIGHARLSPSLVMQVCTAEFIGGANIPTLAIYAEPLHRRQ
jgi:hypothetical protein